MGWLNFWNTDRDSGPLGGPQDAGGISGFVPDGQPTPKQSVVTSVTALNCAAVWAAVTLISEAFGCTPAHVYRKRKSGTLDKATDHEIQQVIDEIDYSHPSERVLDYTTDGAMVPSVYRSAAQGHLCLGGNHYAEVAKNTRGQATKLFMLQPRTVQVFLNRTGQPYYHVFPQPQLAEDTEVVGMQFPQNSAVPEVFHYDDMLHVKGFSQDGITGKSPIRCARESLGVSLLQDTYATQQLLRGRPLGFLKSLTRLGPKALKRIWSNWRNWHEGVDNIRKVGVLHGGLEWVDMGFSNADMEFLSQRKFQNYEVARWFRCPPHMLGELTDAKYSDIEQLMLEFILFTMLPWVTRWEQEFKLKLFTYSESFNHYVYFDLDYWLRGDSATRAEVNQIKLRSAVITPDDWRAEEKKPPLPDGIGSHPLVMASQYDMLQRVIDGTSKLQGKGADTSSSDGTDKKKMKNMSKAEVLAMVSEYLNNREEEA